MKLCCNGLPIENIFIHFAVALQAKDGYASVPPQVCSFQPEDGFLVHTNHSLGSEVGLREDGIENSRIRLERANELIKEGESEELELARKVLLDEKNSPESIMRPYSKQPKLSNHLVGSCASLVMELGKGLIHIKKGPRPDVVYETYSLYA